MFPCFFVCLVILDYVMHIVALMLRNSGFCYIPLKSIDFFCLFQQTVNLSEPKHQTVSPEVGSSCSFSPNQAAWNLHAHVYFKGQPKIQAELICRFWGSPSLVLSLWDIQPHFPFGGMPNSIFLFPNY